jgi:hypothetical protein
MGNRKSRRALTDTWIAEQQVTVGFNAAKAAWAGAAATAICAIIAGTFRACPSI